MKRVDQIIFGPEKGDCYRACVASILELPLEAVPNFMEGGPRLFQRKVDKYFDQVGLKELEVTVEDPSFLDGVWSIGSGPSPRSNGDKDMWHAVVCYSGGVVHDPHPDKTEFPIEIHSVFVVKDMSKGMPVPCYFGVDPASPEGDKSVRLTADMVRKANEEFYNNLPPMPKLARMHDDMVDAVAYAMLAHPTLTKVTLRMRLRKMLRKFRKWLRITAAVLWSFRRT